MPADPTTSRAPGEFDVEDSRALGVLAVPVHAGVFELIRRAKGGASLAELASASALSQRVVSAAVDALVGIGLVRRIRARATRTTRFAAECQQITIIADSDRPEHVAAVHAHFRATTSDISDALRDAEGLTGALAEHQHRIDARMKLDLRPEEWREFLRRIRSVYDYLDDIAASRRARSHEGSRGCDPVGSDSPRCNHVLSIQLAPTVTPLLPSPAIRMASRSRAESATQSNAKHALLTPRERQVATLAAAGIRRREVAEKVGISIHTVATLLQRAYRKLDVRSRKALKQRLARSW